MVRNVVASNNISIISVVPDGHEFGSLFYNSWHIYNGELNSVGRTKNMIFKLELNHCSIHSVYDGAIRKSSMRI